MLMPGRSGSLIQGEWTEGGYGILANLIVDNRSGNQPVEYVATESIEFLPGFESGVGDAFVAYIDPEAVGGNGGEGSGLYRYGFNGKENDNEVKGEGNQQDYGMRIYDGRLGRILSVDPLTKGYPELTPYQFSSNTPIQATDLDGEEASTAQWKLWFWQAKAALTPKRGESVVDKLRDGNNAANSNYGRFDSRRSISEQVEENQNIVRENKIKIYGDAGKGGMIMGGIALSPYIIGGASVALPELFAVAGSSQLSAAGSYFVKSTVSAFWDASSQQIVSGKVDWIDVASNYLPVKNGFQKILSTAFQSTIDYDNKKGFQIAGLNKDIDEAGIDAFATASISVIFGKYNKALEEAFKVKGVDDKNITKTMGKVIKSQVEFISGLLRSGISETAKEK